MNTIKEILEAEKEADRILAEAETKKSRLISTARKDANALSAEFETQKMKIRENALEKAKQMIEKEKKIISIRGKKTLEEIKKSEKNVGAAAKIVEKEFEAAFK